MSSSFFTTTTSTETTRLDSNYVIDSFLPSNVYPKHAKMGGAMLTCTPTSNSQSNFTTYDCLPEHQQQTTPTGGIPFENLTIQHSMDNNNEWISDLNYSTTTATTTSNDMNFLFAYNDLVIGSKEIPQSTASESSVISINEDMCVRSQFTLQQQQQQPIKSSPEQQRRYSMMDMTSRNQPYAFPTGDGQWIDSLFYQPPTADNMVQKERSSMPNVFMGQQSTYLTEQQQQQQQQQHYPTSWQQQQRDLLQKKPSSSNCSTPIKEEKEGDLLLYENFNMMTPSTSVSSPLKQHIKKRSIVDQVLHEEEISYMPSVVSSMSEPIPTSTWMNQPISRKRTKSSMHKEGCHPMDSSTMTSSDHEPARSHENYQVLANDLLPPSDITSHDYSNNTVLAAMPRRQKLRYEGDHYTPKWVRYTGHLKEGYCDSCNPGKWLQLKNSAYWYHKQFYHGISSVSGKLFIKPIEQRIGKGDMIEGLCHQCHRYVPACNGKKKNNYMLWYRHAHKCHLYDKPKSATKTNQRKSSIASSSTSPVHTPSSITALSAFNS